MIPEPASAPLNSQSPRPQGSRTLALRLYAGLIAGLWSISALPLLLRSRHLWPTTPLWLPPPFFDFGCYYYKIKLLHHPGFWTAVGPSWDYPAPGVFVYKLFYAFNRGDAAEHQVHFGFIAYLIFAAAALLAAGVGLGRAMHRRCVPWIETAAFLSVSLLLCWPIYFSLQRGNIEFFLDAGIALGVWAYVRRQWWVFAVLLGIFGSGKLYPLLLLSLLLPLRRWKEFALGLGTAGAVTFFSARWIGPAPAIDHKAHAVVDGLLDWVRANSLTVDLHLSGFDHSIFGAMKLINQGHPQQFALWAIGYVLVGSIGMLLLFFGRMWSLPRPNQLLLVVLAALLLPPTSFDYTMLLLLPAWAWMVLIALQPAANRGTRRAILAVMVVLALLFAPETFAVWRGVFFAGQVKLICLLALLGIAATIPFDEQPKVAV